MWEFKDCREAIKHEMWSYSKAQDEERSFKNRTLNRPKDGDSFADVEQPEEHGPVPEKDARRFASVVDYERESPKEEYELKEFGHGDVPVDEMGEEDSLIHRNNSTKQQKKGLFTKSKGDSSTSKAPSKTHVRKSEKTRLMNEEPDDSSSTV